MIATDLRSGVEQLGDMIAEASTIVPFTGAGISTECGIPDFRSPGRIVNSQPADPVRRIRCQSGCAGRGMAAALRDGADVRRRETGTRPPRACLALQGRQDPAIVTQNIDNLHQVSGFAAEHVIELHGNTTYARCIGCGQAYDLAWVKLRFEETGGAPDCAECDEPVKTATISFGQAMPEDAMRRATELAQHCDLFIAIGSSLVVWPAAGFPMMAKNCGARLVIINNEPTEQDDIADLVIRHDIGETLGPFVGN